MVANNLGSIENQFGIIDNQWKSSFENHYEALKTIPIYWESLNTVESYYCEAFGVIGNH